MYCIYGCVWVESHILISPDYKGVCVTSMWVTTALANDFLHTTPAKNPKICVFLEKSVVEIHSKKTCSVFVLFSITNV